MAFQALQALSYQLTMILAWFVGIGCYMLSLFGTFFTLPFADSSQGDSLSDILAAKETATTSIAVTWGHQSLEHLLRGEPDYVVNSPHDLVKVIEKQNGSSVFQCCGTI